MNQAQVASAEPFDVVVLGGGPAGVPAAIQAARLGARVLLVEKQGQLGGTTTVAGVTAIQTFFAYGQPVIAGIGWDLVCRSFAVLGQPAPDGSQHGPANGVTATVVDRAVYTAVVEEGVLAAGVDLRLHTMLGDLRPDGPGWRLTLCGKEGLYDVRAGVVVDCSGDANAIRRAGLEVVRQPERQPGTLMLGLAGYDAAGLDYAAIQLAFDEQVAAGVLRRSDTGWFGGDVRPLLRGYGGNCVHVVAADASDSRGKTANELEARRIMLRLLRFFRTQRGLERLVISWFAAESGVRETVVIRGRATIGVADYEGGRLWPDAIAYSFYPIDVHTEAGLVYRPLPRGVVPTIPYGSLLPVAGRNILAAGRSISGDREAFSAYRVQATCMAVGQAAGAAAALGVQQGVDVADVPVEAIRAVLRGHGAIVPPDLTPARA